ncbi:hypothetical protein [Kineosporia mesophila]|nr:hypothetical protein [Kineosporia mesophila]
MPSFVHENIPRDDLSTFPNLIGTAHQTLSDLAWEMLSREPM